MTTATTTEARDWTIVTRNPRANHFNPSTFAGTWQEAADHARAIGILNSDDGTELDVYYVHTDDDQILSARGTWVPISGPIVDPTFEPHNHRLEDIVGYRVVETGDRGIGANHYHHGATSYATALAVADTIRKAVNRGWARIDSLRDCGCWSTDLGTWAEDATKSTHGRCRPNICFDPAKFSECSARSSR